MADEPTPPAYLAFDAAAFRRVFLSRFDVRDRAALHELGRLRRTAGRSRRQACG
jgi:hypothetical protein